MSLLSGFNLTLAEISLMGQSALAAFAGGSVPNGWNVITPGQLGVSSTYWDGNYFTDPSSGASAIVLQQGATYIISFRGTDGANDVQRFPELAFGTYISHYQPLLNAINANVPGGSSFYFTGASLGGGATNLMANIASSQYGGRFAGAKFVAFASPNISDANGILNFGAENDPVYKLINNYGNFASSLDHLVFATPEYIAGNYDGQHPFDAYAHSQSALGLDALNRLSHSTSYPLMNPDSVVIIDDYSGVLQDITPGRENTGVFYLGQSTADQITGRAGNDFLEGFSGNDILNGGAGIDTALFSGNRANYTISQSGLTTTVTDQRAGSPDGTDTLTSIEILQFADGALASAAYLINNQTTHVQTIAEGTPYSGPVAGLQFQYINLTSDNLNVTALLPNGFLHTGSGSDAIDVSTVSGINVLDGGTNSNFLVGGTAAGSFDTFFVDDRNPPGDIWSTVANFHKGDDATVWGVTQNGFKTAFVDGEGAAGYTGLTLHVTAPGVPTASLTLSGYTTADLTNGKLSTSFGNVDGTPYFYVHGNS